MATMSGTLPSLTPIVQDLHGARPELHSVSPAIQPGLCHALPTATSVTPALIPASSTVIPSNPVSKIYKCQTLPSDGVDLDAGLDHCRPYPEQTIDHQPILQAEIVHHPILYPYTTSTPAHDPPKRSCRCQLFPELESPEKGGAANAEASPSRQPTFVPFVQSELPSPSPVCMNPQCEELQDQSEDLTVVTEQDLGPPPGMDGQDTEGQGACYQSHPPSEGEDDQTEAATALLNCSNAEEDSHGAPLGGCGSTLAADGGQVEVDPAHQFESPFTKTLANCSRSRGNFDTKDNFNNNYEAKNGNQNDFRGGKNKNNYNKRGGNSQGGNNNFNRNRGNKKNRGQNRNTNSSGNTGGGGDLLVDVDGPADEVDQGDGASLVDPVEVQGQGRYSDRSGPAPWGMGTAYLFGNDSSKKAGGGEGGGNVNNNYNKNKNNGNKNNNSGGGGGGNNNNNYNNNQNKKTDNNSTNGNNNGSTSGKGGGGGEMKWDALSRHVKQLCYNVGLLRRPTAGPGYTLDSLCLHCHHRGLVFFFLLCYLVVACNWFTSEQIMCYMTSHAEKPETRHYRDICLSYIYVQESGSRRYLLFYRYLHYGLLQAAAISYVLRCGYVKKWEDPRLGRLWADVWKDRQNYESSLWRDSSDRVLQYLLSGQPNTLHYYKWILCHLLTNLLDVALMLYFDFMLQGHFLWLVPETLFPLQRDPATFSDRLSTLFPPFVDCEITELHKILSGNKLHFGCHLTLMELYEKVFVTAWLVIAFHWLWSLLMVVWLVLGLLPYVGIFSFVLAGGLVERRSLKAMFRVNKLCSLGDVHVLYLMKRWMSNVQFLALLDEVIKSKEEQLLKRQSQRYKSALIPLYPIDDHKNTVIQMETDNSRAARDALYFYKSGQIEQDGQTQPAYVSCPSDIYPSAKPGDYGNHASGQTVPYGGKSTGWTVPVGPPSAPPADGARWPAANEGQYWARATEPQQGQLQHDRRTQALLPPPDNREQPPDAAQYEYLLRNRANNAHRGSDH